jgi:hypothetical protein
MNTTVFVYESEKLLKSALGSMQARAHKSRKLFINHPVSDSEDKPGCC